VLGVRFVVDRRVVLLEAVDFFFVERFAAVLFFFAGVCVAEAEVECLAAVLCFVFAGAASAIDDIANAATSATSSSFTDFRIMQNPPRVR